MVWTKSLTPNRLAFRQKYNNIEVFSNIKYSKRKNLIWTVWQQLTNWNDSGNDSNVAIARIYSPASKFESIEPIEPNHLLRNPCRCPVAGAAMAHRRPAGGLTTGYWSLTTLKSYCHGRHRHKSGFGDPESNNPATTGAGSFFIPG